MAKAEKRNTEQAILEAAEEMFLEHGYLSATTVMIARKAGVTHAMLHYYFRTKEQIFVMVLDRKFMQMTQFMRPVMTREAPFWETMSEGICRFFSFLKANPNLPGLIYEVSRHMPQLLSGHRDNMLNTANSMPGLRMKMLLEEEISQGHINPISYNQLFFTIMTMCISPFLTTGVLREVMGMSDEGIDAFFTERQNEVIETLRMRLYGK